VPAPPVLPPVLPPVVPAAPPPWRPDEPNPFADDDDFKTVADVIPVNAEASRLHAEPSWTVARESAALGELQRWVQESRNAPKSRREALTRKLDAWHQRVISWTYRKRLPRWSPYAVAGAALLLVIVLLAQC
jgi:hypothetical protein